MNSINNQASLNNKENLAPIGSIRNPTSHCYSQTGEAANNQNKPLTNKKTPSHKEELSKKYKVAKSVFKAALPHKKLLYRKYLLEGMKRENIEKARDFSRHKEATSAKQTRQASTLESLKTPNASPQKNKTPTDVTTTKISNLSALQQKRDIGTQTSTTDAQRPIVIVSPTHYSQKRASRASQTSAPSFNQSSDNIDEQQQKKRKVDKIDMNMTRAYFDEFTIEENGIEFVTIGENGTIVWKEFLLELNWNNTGAAITRKLLCHLFDAKTLATHTLTGKPSLVFLSNQPKKRQLNQLIVQDIIKFMMLLKDMKATDVKTVINDKCVNVAKKFLRSLSAKAFAPPEANVTRNPETMFAVSAARNVISVPKVKSSVPSKRNVISVPKVKSSDSCETVEISSDSDSSETIVV